MFEIGTRKGHYCTLSNEVVPTGTIPCEVCSLWDHPAVHTVEYGTSGPFRGLFWGLVLSAPVWLAIGYVIWRSMH